MKIRLWGTKDECQLAAERLLDTPGLRVVSISEPRADRGASVLFRVYIEARLDQAPAEHVTATAHARPRGRPQQKLPSRLALPPGGNR
jgi:hypothetical protein